MRVSQRLLGRHRGRLRHCLFNSLVEGVLAASQFQFDGTRSPWGHLGLIGHLDQFRIRIGFLFTCSADACVSGGFGHIWSVTPPRFSN